MDSTAFLPLGSGPLRISDCQALAITLAYLASKLHVSNDLQVFAHTANCDILIRTQTGYMIAPRDVEMITHITNSLKLKHMGYCQSPYGTFEIYLNANY